jgi:hypothetical protein
MDKQCREMVVKASQALQLVGWESMLVRSLAQASLLSLTFVMPIERTGISTRRFSQTVPKDRRLSQREST